MTTNIIELMETKSSGELLRELKKITEFDFDAVNSLGQSPLMLAVLSNDLAVTAFLLNQGYSPVKKDDNLLSPFIAAAANGFDEIFELILLYNDQLDVVNRFGGTALLPSSEKGFLKVVMLAAEGGVPVNHVNRLVWSALLEAVILGDGGFLYEDVIRELMRQGADVDLRDDLNKSAVDYAEERNQAHILNLLAGNLSDEFENVRQLMRQKDFYAALKTAQALETSPRKDYYLGFIYEQLKDFSGAKFYYTQGLKTDPQFAFLLANIAKKERNIDEAFKYFDLGIERTSDHFFKYHKSNLLREVGKHQEAVLMMDELLAEEPQRVDYLFHKANSLRSLGRHQAAKDAMELATTLAPNNPLFPEHAQQSLALLS